MRISSIKKISNVGILNSKSFENNFNLEVIKDGKKDIAKKVLIKGNNGTGKTTLSNIFRSMQYNGSEECNAIIEGIKTYDKENIEIEIELSDNSIIKYSATTGEWKGISNNSIRVFNEDYIVKNIDFSDLPKLKETEPQFGKLSEEKIEYEKIKEEYRKKTEEIEDKKKQFK